MIQIKVLFGMILGLILVLAGSLMSNYFKIIFVFLGCGIAIYSALQEPDDKGDTYVQ